MSEPDPKFDAVHPSAAVVFRSCPGGYLHSVLLAEAATAAGAESLARAVLLTAEVSHLRAVMDIRRGILDAGFTPSSEIPSPADLDAAEAALRNHRLG